MVGRGRILVRHVHRGGCLGLRRVLFLSDDDCLLVAVLAHLLLHAHVLEDSVSVDKATPVGSSIADCAQDGQAAD